jgi:alginate O-acetyltransferase complex protein AlgI
MIHTVTWWIFLVFGPIIYWNLPRSWRGWALSIGSVGLLALFVGWDLLVMLALAAGTHTAFRWREKSTAILQLLRSPWPTLIILGYLLWGKYLPEFARAYSGEASIFAGAVTLGVSYFTFKLLHYVFEMRRENFPAHGAADFASWMFLAPIFTAGPIERFEHFLRFRQDDSFSWKFVAEGSQRIAHGIVKKFLFGRIVQEAIERICGGGILSMLASLDQVSPLTVWGLLFLSFVYLYLDFSAYSDIAIGSSRLFGLTIMENFNFPIVATSLPMFWQRWHMTLANWCLSYIYLAMIGLTRNPYAAGIATFTTIGAWHALSPHWLAWGLWNGLGMAAVSYWRRFANVRKINFFKTLQGRLTGWSITMIYVALGGCFTILYQKATLWDSFRLLFRAFGI